MKAAEIDKKAIMIDKRYLFTMTDGRVLNRRGIFLMACDPDRGYHLDERKLAAIAKIDDWPLPSVQAD